ncbi:MAG: hypothetical protein ISS77_02500 [Phycisphaerae bacterium]|nr:hypothetical protein [Planctomycetota bacterium]MBL7106466.1 hypothetical protein [Phycisphaerae bacterium]
MNNEKMISLFGYESGACEINGLRDYPLLFERASGQGGKELDENFAEWKKSKREFKVEEIKGTWKKLGDNGRTYLISFYPDNTLLEQHCGEGKKTDKKPSWEGRWELVDGVLKTHISKYQVYYFANKTTEKHSGIEYIDELTPNACYTLTPYRPFD